MKKTFIIIFILGLFSMAHNANASFSYQGGLIKEGSRGAQVRDLQQCLIDLGTNPDSNLDGIFGPVTAGAVKAFQASQGILIDGIIGPVTGPRYEQACSASTQTEETTQSFSSNDDDEESSSVRSSGGGVVTRETRDLVNGCDRGLLPFGGGSGTVADPYLLCTARQFQGIAGDLDANYEVRSDIDFEGHSFEPIGTAIMITTDDVISSAAIADNVASVVFSSQDYFDHSQEVFVAGNMSGNLDEGDFAIVSGGKGNLSFSNTADDVDLKGGGGEALIAQVFSGDLDGGDYTLSNITISCQDVYSCGIFSGFAGTLSDLNINTINVTHNNGSGTVAYGASSALVAYWLPNVDTGTGSTINDVHINGGTYSSDTKDYYASIYATGMLAAAQRFAVGISRGDGMSITNSSIRDFAVTMANVNYSETGLVSGSFANPSDSTRAEFENIYAQGSISVDSNGNGLTPLGGVFGRIARMTINNLHGDVDITIDSDLNTIDSTPCCSIYFGKGGGLSATLENWGSTPSIVMSNVIVEGSVSAPWLSVVTGGATPANGANTSKRIGALSGTAAGLPSWGAGTVTLTDVLALTEVDVPNYPDDGDLGFIPSSTTPARVTCTDCYFNTTTTGQTSSYSGFGSAQNDAWFKTASNFSFLDTDVWKIEDAAYPCILNVSPGCTE